MCPPADATGTVLLDDVPSPNRLRFLPQQWLRPSIVIAQVNRSPAEIVFDIARTANPTLTLTGEEVPPPGGGVETVTFASANWARSEEGIATDRCAESTHVVVRS